MRQSNMEKITEAFTRAVLLFPIDTKEEYDQLSRRLVDIIFRVVNSDIRVKKNQDLMEV